MDSESASDTLEDKPEYDVLDIDLAHWSNKSFSWDLGKTPEISDNCKYKGVKNQNNLIHTISIYICTK